MTTCAIARIFTLVALMSVPCGMEAQQTLRAHVDITRNGHRLNDGSEAVIWLNPLGGPVETPHQSQIPQLVQKDKSFHPSLVVIPVGGKVEFPNHDPFFHNVFSLFEGKRFDLGLYESGSSRVVQFDKPGISFIFCNIHAQMSAVVIALSTPYYAISDAEGEMTIHNAPPGRYELQVFHMAVAPDALRTLTREVTVSSDETSLGTFTLAEHDVTMSHKNKYGHDYDRPEPDSPAYARP